MGASTMAASVVIIRAGDRGRVLQRGAHDLGRVDDARRDHVDILFGLGVEAERRRGVFSMTLPTTIEPSTPAVLGDLTDRSLQGATDDGDARVLVGVVALHAVQNLGRLEQADAAAGRRCLLPRPRGSR